jgi:hypothetical protein
MDGHELIDHFESEAVRRGGGAKRGTICHRELVEAQEIRVSIRPPTSIGSTELFTLRDLEPGDYHLILVAIPRNEGQQLV